MFALVLEDMGERARRVGGAARVPQTPANAQCFSMESPGLGQVTFVVGDFPEIVQDECDSAPIARLLPNGKAFTKECPGLWIVALRARELPQVVEHPGHGALVAEDPQ